MNVFLGFWLHENNKKLNCNIKEKLQDNNSIVLWLGAGAVGEDLGPSDITYYEAFPRIRKYIYIYNNSLPAVPSSLIMGSFPETIPILGAL